MDDLIKKVHEANGRRTMDTYARRLLKLGEEYGEANQAYLSISSENNGKNKTWLDVREELVDVLVVTLDLLCHRLPGDEALSPEDKASQIHAEVDRKLRKWIKKQGRNTDTAA